MDRTDLDKPSDSQHLDADHTPLVGRPARRNTSDRDRAAGSPTRSPQPSPSVTITTPPEIARADAETPKRNGREATESSSSPSEASVSGRKLYSLALPQVAPGANLARVTPGRWRIAIIFGVTLLLYLAFVPRFLLYSSPPTGDQAFYLMVMSSLEEDGDLNIANNYAGFDFDKFYNLAPRPAGFVGISAPYPFSPALAHSIARPTEEQYSNHAPGLPILLLPAWMVGSWLSLWWPATVVMMCVIGALVATNVFLLAYETTGRVLIAGVVWLPVAFSNPVFSYSFMIFTELTTGLLLVYAFRRLSMGWESNGRLRLFLIGLCIAYMPWLAWRALLIALPLLVYAIIQWWRHARKANPPGSGPGDRRVWKKRIARLGWGSIGWREARSLAWVLAPIVALWALLAGYNMFLFGSFLQPNRVPELGDRSPFYWPWQGIEELSRFVTTAFALLFDRRMGLLTFTPLLLLAAVGMIALFRTGRNSSRGLLLAMALVSLPYLGMIASFVYWNGLWCPPARYQTTFVPLLAAPLAMSLFACRGLLYKGLYALLAIPGFIATYIFIDDARTMWPIYTFSGWVYESASSPFHGNIELAQRFENMFPAFSPLDELRLPANTAWMTAASVIIVLISYLIMSRSRGGFMPGARRLPRAMHVLLWIGAIGLVTGSWFFINREHLKPRTILTENTRWGIGPPLIQAEGIAYHKGSIYLADYRGAQVGRLELDRSAYAPLQLSGSEGVSFARPGDMATGPDGRLYLLNNGEGENALYTLEPDGKLVGRFRLEGKSEVAVGAAFGPDGSLYVSDMVGGKLLKYSKEGGTPISVFTAPSGGFNNVKGVVVAQDGSIYAAEIGGGKIHRFNPDHTYNRVYELGNCKPLYMAIASNWLEVSCEGKLLTLNSVTGGVQNVMVENASQPQSPNGLTYGPDGTLYVMDGNTVVAYRVRH